MIEELQEFELRDLFKIKDALDILKKYDLADDELYYEIKCAIEFRVDGKISA